MTTTVKVTARFRWFMVLLVPFATALAVCGQRSAARRVLRPGVSVKVERLP
jgi:hypothetical protein